jgi:phosphate transport system permease protein
MRPAKQSQGDGPPTHRASAAPGDLRPQGTFGSGAGPGNSRSHRRRRIWPMLEERLMKALMLLSFVLLGGALVLIVGTVVVRGLPGLTWEMITQPPKGGFYMGKEGGILNAILGSLALAVGATLLALVLALPMTLYLNTYARGTRLAGWVRLTLDVMWGVPSIVYGAFGFTLMLWLGLRASLLAGVITLALLELPILVRAVDEVMKLIPHELPESAAAMGATRTEVAFGVIVRQALPGIVTATLLAFGRGIGDAASVLFTAGYTDRLPTSLLRPVATLPLAVFFQLGTPFPAVQQRAYTSALVLTIIILVVSLGSRWLAARLSRNVIK